MNEFDNKKNVRAGTYTGIVCGLLALLFFIVSWTLPTPPPPPDDLGIEVNLGNSETGSGDIQPMIPGPPAAAEKEVNAPPRTQITQAEEAKDVETNDEDKEAPDVSVPKPLVSKPDNKNIPKKDNSTPVKTPKAKPQVVDNPAPPVKKPIAVYKGGDGTGKGGNNADTWNGSRNQGIAGGSGDQGKINGDPNSDSYTGNGGSGKSGVSIAKGLKGRRITHLPSFEDDFNENAKVAIDVRVDSKGNVISASFQPKGSTTSDGNLREIALRKARSLKFSDSPDGIEQEIGTIIFNFRLKS